MRRSRGADDDVGAAGRFVKLCELDDLGHHGAGKLLGHAARALGGAIAHQDGAGALLYEVPRGNFAHFSRAHQKNCAPLERTKDFTRQIDGHGCNGNRVRTDSGLAARSFCRRKRALQQMFQLTRDGSRGARHGEGFFHLAQNLRLAHHHRVKACGHAKQVAHRFLVVVLVQMRRKHLGFYAEVAGQEVGDRGVRALHGSQQLHAVTGGDDHALGDSRRRSQRAGGLGQVVAADRDLLPESDGRRLVVNANECECHWGPNLCTWLKKLTAQTAIITTNATPET